MSYNDIADAIPVEDAVRATHTSVAYFRQNPWKTDTYSPYITIHSKKLHIPFAHGPTMTVENAPQQAQLGLSLQVGDIVVIAYGNQQGLLVKITSEVKRGIVEPIYIALDPAQHYQEPHEYSSGIKGVVLAKPFYKSSGELVNGVRWALDKNYILEPFYGLYRDIEIVGILTGVDDWRKIVGMSSSGKRVIQFLVRPYQQFSSLHYRFGEVDPNMNDGPYG